MIDLSPQQEKAANLIMDWYLNQPLKQVFYLAGYAGTGKTTSVNVVIDRIRQKEELNVCYCAFTGKAASVLSKKGNTPSSTIHSLIYRPDIQQVPVLDKQGNPVYKKNGEPEMREQLVFVLKTPQGELGLEYDPGQQVAKDFLSDLIFETDLIVLDECSMVDQDLANDLMSFEKKILVIGDPGQLPPVSGQGAFTNQEPDYVLTEVRRQALDNPILYLATKARNGEFIGRGTYGDVKILERNFARDYYEEYKELTAEDPFKAQYLCGKNSTRRQINNGVRSSLGFKSIFPMENDLLICLRNNRKRGLYNGLIDICPESWDKTNEWSSPAAIKLLKDRDETLLEKLKDNPLKFGEEPYSTPNGYPSDLRYFAANFLDDEKIKEVCEKERRGEAFDFGYCITVHKSQGSEWDKVYLIDESVVFGPNKNKHLYTGITRASKQLIIFK